MFACCRPCTVWSTLQEDGITVLLPIFETWEAKNLSWNFASGLSETKMGSFRPCAWCMLMTSYWRAVTLDGINNLYEWRTWESRVFTQCGARPEHEADFRSVSQNT